MNLTSRDPYYIEERENNRRKCQCKKCGSNNTRCINNLGGCSADGTNCFIFLCEDCDNEFEVWE